MKPTPSLVKWQRFVNNILINPKRDFVIHEKNATKMVVWNSEKQFRFMYRKRLTKEELEKMWIFGSVKKSFKSYIKKNPKFEILDNVPPTSKNTNKVNDLQPGEVFLATDASHCYWRISRNLEYISENLYQKCATEEFKLQRNKALACTASVDKMHIYELGEYKKTVPDPDGDPRFHMLYSNVRFKSYELMRACMIACGSESFLKYKIDCVYYMPDRKDAVEAIFNANDVLFKTNECVYIGDGYFIEYDGKDDKVKKL